MGGRRDLQGQCWLPLPPLRLPGGTQHCGCSLQGGGEQVCECRGSPCQSSQASSPLPLGFASSSLVPWFPSGGPCSPLPFLCSHFHMSGPQIHRVNSLSPRSIPEPGTLGLSSEFSLDKNAFYLCTPLGQTTASRGLRSVPSPGTGEPLGVDYLTSRLLFYLVLICQPAHLFIHLFKKYLTRWGL